MRVYKEEVLRERTIEELKVIRDSVSTSIELSYNEKKANIDTIDRVMNQSSFSIRYDILEEIQQSMADIDDLKDNV